MTDLLPLLRNLRTALRLDHPDWKDANPGGLLHDLDGAIAELEAAPERKCGTCRDWHCFIKTEYSNLTHGRLAVCECSNQRFEVHARRYSKGKQVDSDFGCIFWQPRGGSHD